MKKFSGNEHWVRRQRGISLIVTLVILVIVTLGSVALVRSVDTGNLIAGNLAFRQSARLAADRGLEDAINWLEQNRGSLSQDSGHYLASWIEEGVDRRGQLPNETWEDFWNAISTNGANNRARAVPWGGQNADPAGNQVDYVIQRLCPVTGALVNGAPKAGCVYTVTTACGGQSKVAGGGGPSRCFLPQYRITVRVRGPRNTVSYVQSVVAL